jgi:tetratricopeptide (TPR) repeat protein
MNLKARRLVVFLVALSLVTPGMLWAQDRDEVAKMMNAGFDLLQKGNYREAQQVYEELLKKDPTQPLALNNLAAIMVKQGKYDRALGYLKQALSHAKGHRVTLNRVCDVEGVCAVCRMSEGQFGSEDLAAILKSNILMVQMAKSSRSGAK